MTYRCGIGAGLGPIARDPGVYCDGVGCHAAVMVRGDAPVWLLKRKAPPGWKLIRRENEDGSIFRRDYCPQCKGGVTCDS